MEGAGELKVKSDYIPDELDLKNYRVTAERWVVRLLKILPGNLTPPHRRFVKEFVTWKRQVPCEWLPSQTLLPRVMICCWLSVSR